MSEEHVYTEQELSKMADALLEEADHVEIPAEPSRGKKKPAKKKDAAPEQSTKTPEERLNELLEKGKKAGKLTAKELECLEEMNLDGEVVDKFYETLEKNGIDIDVGADDKRHRRADGQLLHGRPGAYVPQGNRQGAAADSRGGGRACHPDVRGQ